MGHSKTMLFGASALMLSLLWPWERMYSEEKITPIVRLAELEIDPAQLEQYKEFLEEEIESTTRLEPGVLTLFAVSLKEDPNQIRIFETYVDLAAYEAHLKTPHFIRYKEGTRNMVRSLRLLETDTIRLGGANSKR
ncbi:MAG: antibiotic biosynthesis monooxygenase [Bryobacteraceae bacterium]|nr:antibiotic biosynthesis monooxygenase [Bryobacteraceae bacterium]